MAKKKRGADQTDQLSPRQTAFESAWNRFKPLVPEDELAELEASLSLALEPAIRLNPQKKYGSGILQLERRYGWQAEPVAFCADAYKLQHTGETAPGQTNEHRAGAFYIQDSASMLPVTLFDQELLQNRPLILDLAASPGGKTTHLSAASRESGLILANDSSASRITALKKVLRNWGSVNHLISNFPGEFFGSWFPDTFDIVLLDAPCSMQSLVSIDSHPMRPISEREEAALAQRQLQLLTSAMNALKPGGQLVYSTCTLSPLEDELVVDQLLKQFGSAVQVVDVQSRLPRPAPGLAVVDGVALDASLTGTVRLWPHRLGTAGFFAALLKKKEPAGFSGNREQAPERPWERSGFQPLVASARADLTAEFSELFGIDFQKYLDEKMNVLWAREDEIWVLPEHLFDSPLTGLPLKSAGLRIAYKTSAGWMPDFDFASLIFDRVQSGRYQLDETLTAAWLRKEDLRISVPGAKKGSVLFMEDPYQVFIGCGVVSGERIRNLKK